MLDTTKIQNRRPLRFQTLDDLRADAPAAARMAVPPES